MHRSESTALARTVFRVPPPRSLADDLRERTDDELAQLLVARPDLVHPAPADLSALAARSSSQPSTARALGALDTAHLHTLHAIVVRRGGVDIDDLARLLRASPSRTGELVHSLWERALLWRSGTGMAPTRTVIEALKSTRLKSDVAELVTPAQLLTPPELAGPQHQPAAVDAAAGFAASETLQLIVELLDHWSARPPRVLRTGGVAVRDLRAITEALDITKAHAAYLIELASAAELLADNGRPEPLWAPTADYDEWLDEAPEQQWIQLAQAWMRSTRAAHRVGARPTGAGPISVLAAEVTWMPVRGLRQAILEQLVTAGRGRAPSVEAISAAVRWQRPRRVPQTLDAVVRAVLHEATWLGVTAYGAISTAGRALVAPHEEPTGLGEAIGSQLPPPLDAILLQSDLTAVAPGPVTGELARLLRGAADIESRGVGTVYRFSEASVRRALEHGWNAPDLVLALARHSRTPVPQPLDYLVRDAARRHGQVRVRAARAAIRVDDEALLTAIANHRELGALQLSQIAPTVLISPVSAELVIDVLRAHGFAPVAESAAGTISVVAPDRHRAPRPRRSNEPVVSRVDRDLIDQAIKSMRGGQALADSRTARAADGIPSIPTGDPTTSMAILRDAAADRRAVWVGYSDATGAISRMLFYPERIEGGRVMGAADGVARTLSIHRITGVLV